MYFSVWITYYFWVNILLVNLINEYIYLFCLVILYLKIYYYFLVTIIYLSIVNFIQERDGMLLYMCSNSCIYFCHSLTTVIAGLPMLFQLILVFHCFVEPLTYCGGTWYYGYYYYHLDMLLHVNSYLD